MVSPVAFREELLENLHYNILPFWLHRMADPRGGFYGRIDGMNRLDVAAPKGAILNGRLLWSLSAAFRTTGHREYMDVARTVRDYIIDYFVDQEMGGVYWSVSPCGNPIDTKKQFYAIGFVIYGLSEFVRASKSDPHYSGRIDTVALDYAIRLYRDIEEHSHDRQNLGYLEACTRDWKPIEDMRLSDKDENAAKTMNTHLHIIEPYTNLYRVWPDAGLRKNILELMHIFLDIIEDQQTHHLGLFYDMHWRRQDGNESFGHDIEASWLLLETAQVLLEVDKREGDPQKKAEDEALLQKTLKHTEQIALASFDGLKADGSMVYEKFKDGTYNSNLDWWVQAENVIGQIYLWKYHNKDGRYDCMYERAYKTWTWIKQHLVDREVGEWHWGRKDASKKFNPHSPVGPINRADDKAGFWKCPYHNSRMCMEVAAQLL